MSHAPRPLGIYVGQTRSRVLIADLTVRGWGEATQPDEWPPRRSPVMADNGAFKLWRAGKAFDETAFGAHVERVARDGPVPRIVVVPDVVANAPASLALSLAWAPRLAGLGPLYLVAQDGMTDAEVTDALGPFAGVFVGGTLPWKIRTGERWVKLAHAHGRRCHIGRVGTPRRVAWARRIGADSIDSCLPLWSRKQLRQFADAVDDRQPELF